MRGSPAGEEGFTLVEVLIALVVLSFSIVLLVGGLGVVTRTSSLYRSQTNVSKGLVSAAERLVDPAVAFVYCADENTATYKAAVAVGDAEGSGVRITDVWYWDGSAFTSTAPAAATCSDDVDRYGQQLIFLSGPSSDAGTVNTLQVVKRA